MPWPVITVTLSSNLIPKMSLMHSLMLCFCPNPTFFKTTLRGENKEGIADIGSKQFEQRDKKWGKHAHAHWAEIAKVAHWRNLRNPGQDRPSWPELYFLVISISKITQSWRIFFQSPSSYKIDAIFTKSYLCDFHSFFKGKLKLRLIGTN